MLFKVKKIIKNICIFTIILLLNKSTIDNVFGDFTINFGGFTAGTISGGSGSSGSLGIQNNVIAVGVRVSLVYSNNGTRVEDTHSIDYWNNSGYGGGVENVYMGYHALFQETSNYTNLGVTAGAYAYFKKDTPRHFNIYNGNKVTKQEYVKNIGNRNWYTISSKDGDSSNYKIAFGKKYNKVYSNEFGGTAFIDDVQPGSWSYHKTCWLGSGYPDIGYCYTYFPHSGNYFAYWAVKAISGNLTSLNPDWTAFNKFLINCGWNKKDDPLENIKQAGISGITVQFEPVEYLSESTDNSGHVLYLGSISEIIGMMREGGTLDSWWCGLTGNSETETCRSGNQSLSQLNPAIYAPYVASADLTKTAPTSLAGFTLSKNGAMTKSEINFKANQPKFHENASSPFGVALINLSDFFEDECHVNAKNYIDTNKNNIDEYISNVSTDEKTANCTTPVYYGPYVLFTCDVLDPYNVELFNGYSNKYSSNVCTSYTCQDVADAVFNKYKDQPNQIGVEGSDYETAIARVKEIYETKDGKQYNMLTTNIWQSGLVEGISGPTCSFVKIKSCPVNNLDVKCESSNKSFTISDTNNISDCIKNDVSYNNLDASGNVKGGGNEISQSSKDEIDGNGYCKETVNFVFPGNASNIKAGTVFVWGTQNSVTGHKISNVFGNMTITRTCYLNGKNSITMNWANEYVHPKIAIYYKEAIPSSVTNYSAKKINGDELTIERKRKTIDVYSDESASNKIGSNSSGDVMRCGGNCNNAKMVVMNAYYDIKYGSSFKWNYNKNDNDNNLTLINSDTENNYYAMIGYGLPTTFVTPTGLKGNYIYGESLSDNDGKGYMYIKADNIGTCKDSSSNDCHFNKFLTFALTDDNDNDKKSIYYKCNFSIENELFGYEDNSSKDIDPNIHPKGLDVVFRKIDLVDSSVTTTESIKNELNRAFPGRSGKGDSNRERGKNWTENAMSEPVNDEDAIKILSNDIYNKEPMWHIKLDVKLIKKIREYNDLYLNAGYAPYTSNYNYIFKLKNASDKFSFGSSEFISQLTGLRNADGKVAIDGKCIDGYYNTEERAKRGVCGQEWWNE